MTQSPNAAGTLLAQVRPANTTAATAYTSENKVTEITSIIVCNTTGSPVTFRVFHDVQGTTYDQSNALWYDVSLAANASTVLNSESPNGGIFLNPGDSLGVRVGTGNGITFSIYGVVENRNR